ncbi:MAG: hypothetical protein PUF61_07465 [Spirochaetales bacterium]|nr:hypothetical protein [Spirochaetales bacterium]
MAKVLLLLMALVIAAAVFWLTKKLNDGERKINQGRQRLAKNDNLFVRTFFSDKLANGRKKLAEGTEKLNFWKAVRILLVLACIGCAVAAVLNLVL